MEGYRAAPEAVFFNFRSNIINNNVFSDANKNVSQGGWPTNKSIPR